MCASAVAATRRARASASCCALVSAGHSTSGPVGGERGAHAVGRRRRVEKRNKSKNIVLKAIEIYRERVKIKKQAILLKIAFCNEQNDQWCSGKTV